MKENQCSLTALLTAYVRAHHAKHDEPKIFNDFLAEQLFTPEAFLEMGANLAHSLHFFNPELAATHPDPPLALAWVIQNMMSVTLSRSKFTEDHLDAAITNGAQQYVMLGSGLDTFAFRRPKTLKHLQVFEIDHPATQNYKRSRLAELGWDLPTQLHFVPVDFDKDNLAKALQPTSYNPKALSFYSWLGVTLYLAREVVFDTLRTIAGLVPSGSTIIFDYISAAAFSPDSATQRTQLLQDIVARVGEPLKAGLNPETLGENLRACGWQLQENLSPSDIETRYFQGRSDDYHASDHMYYARATAI